MGPMKFAYQRGGQPILSWKYGPPRQSRSGDAVALGSTLDEPVFTMPLPRPGAPEPLGCGCTGDREIKIDLLSPSFLAGVGAAWLILRYLGRRSSTP